MKDYLKKFYVEHYQRWRWYESFTVAEYSKFVNIISPTLVISLLTLMSVRGYTIHPMKLLLGYLVLNILAILGGKWLVHIGVAKANASFANQQSPEMMRMLEILEKLDKRL